MDTIYVLEEGSIVESGSFNELLKRKGRFAAMWDRQQF
jgi:ABC-type multidrug transport system fused ATPase/permease subunit